MRVCDLQERLVSPGNQGENVGLLIPIASPLADDKLTKRVLKVAKKAAKKKLIRRGVKEVVKALRKGSKGYVSHLNEPLSHRSVEEFLMERFCFLTFQAYFLQVKHDIDSEMEHLNALQVLHNCGGCIPA
jgi:hypothetical protein